MGCHSSKLASSCLSTQNVEEDSTTHQGNSPPGDLSPHHGSNNNDNQSDQQAANSTSDSRPPRKKSSFFSSKSHGKKRVHPTGTKATEVPSNNAAGIKRNPSSSAELNEENITIQVQSSKDSSATTAAVTASESSTTISQPSTITKREVQLSNDTAKAPRYDSTITTKVTSLQSTTDDNHKKRVSLPQVENHIKHMVRQVADDDYFDENEDDENAILQKHLSASTTVHNQQSTSTTQTSPSQLDWNQVINEVMGPDASPVKNIAGAKPSTLSTLQSSSVAASAAVSNGKVHTRSPAYNGADTQDTSLLLDDEFDFDSETEPGDSKASFHSSLAISTSKQFSSTQQVTLTFTCDLSHSPEKSEGMYLPLPLSLKHQKYVRYHSFEPRPLREEIRKIGSDSSCDALFCAFEPDVSQVRYSVDMELELQQEGGAAAGDATSTHDTSLLCVGKKTPIRICSPQHEKIQDIVRQQKWLQIQSKEERIRRIAEFVGQLPYHLDLYDQIYYYLDSGEPTNKSGLQSVFSLLCEASGIEGHVDPSNLTGYIFPNLRENIFVKMCYRELIKIEILNKSQDNEYEKFYL